VYNLEFDPCLFIFPGDKPLDGHKW